MAQTKAQAKKDLRRTISDAKKALKALDNENKIDKELEKWQQQDKLRQNIAKMCRDNGTTLKRLMATPEWYVYADPKGSKKAQDKDVDWVMKAIRGGVSEADMIKRADTLKRKYIASKIKPKRRSKSTTKPSTPSAAGSSKTEAAKSGGIA